MLTDAAIAYILEAAQAEDDGRYEAWDAETHSATQDHRLKWITRCPTCNWIGRMGELIAKDVLRCPKCNSADVELVRPFGSDGRINN